MAGCQLNNKSLVSNAIIVISEDSRDFSNTLNFNIALMIFEGRRQYLVRTIGANRMAIPWKNETTFNTTEVTCDDDNHYENQFSHF